MVVRRDRVHVAGLPRRSRQRDSRWHSSVDCRRRTRPRARSSRSCRRRAPRRTDSMACWPMWPRYMPVRATGVPAEAVRVTHAEGVDLADRPDSPTKGFDGGDAVLAVRAVRARRDRSAGSCRTGWPCPAARRCSRRTRRHRRRGRAGRSPRRRVPAVGLKEICWIAVDLRAEAEPQHLAAGARERVGVRVVGRPLGDDAVDGRVRLRRVRRGLGADSAGLLGVDGVELAVLLELGVERDEPEAAARGRARRRSRGNCALTSR